MSGWPGFSDTSNVGKVTVCQVLPAIPTPLPEKYIRLGSIRQIRGELAAIYRLAKGGRIPTSEATRLTYILTQLANLTVDSELADRIEALEKSRDR